MNKGYAKTYIKLMIGIIIIVLVIVIGMGFIRKEYSAQMIKDIRTDMLLIQAKTKIVGEKVRIKENNANYIGTKVENESQDEVILKLKEKGILDFSVKENNYYILNKEDLEKLDLNSIKLNEGFFIVEYTSNEIIYSNGIQDKNGNVLYKLSDFEIILPSQDNEENENKEEVNK